MKTVAVLAVPFGVITLISPVVAPAGTVILKRPLLRWGHRQFSEAEALPGLDVDTCVMHNSYYDGN